MLARKGQCAENVWIHSVDEECIKTLLFTPYVSKTVELDRHGYETPFLDAALIPSDYRANMVLSKTEVLYLRDMM